MNRTHANQKMSRRKFLVNSGIFIGGIALGCSGLSKYQVPEIAIPTLIPAGGNPRATPSGPPDLILHNGLVLTIDAKDSTAQAVAIKGDLIQKVGTDVEVLALADGESKPCRCRKAGHHTGTD